MKLKPGDRIDCKNRIELQRIKTWMGINGIKTRKAYKVNTLVVVDIVDENKARRLGITIERN